MQSESLDDLLAKAALRQAQIQRLKKHGDEEGQKNLFPPPPSSVEICITTADSSRSKENTNHTSSLHDFTVSASKSMSQATSEPDSRPPEHIKKVFASLADAYRTVDEEDSHPEPSSSSSAVRAPLRSSTSSSKSRSPLKPIKTVESPNNREKRVLDSSVNSSPRPVVKAVKSETQLIVADPKSTSTPEVVIEPTELSLQERKALFEKQVPVKGGTESLSVQDKKALFEKASPKKLSTLRTSPRKPSSGDNHTVRKVLFQEAATKAQLPPSPNKPSRAYSKNVDFEAKSPKKNETVVKTQTTAEFQDQPMEVGVFTRTLQDKLLVQTQAWKNNDVSRKIEEQKEEDMKTLKKRWELMAEEEKRAAARQHEIYQLVEKRKPANSNQASIHERPHPLPLPGSSILHETALKASTVFPPPPQEMLMSPVFDAIARFENPSLKSARNASPPPPPPPPPFAESKVAPLFVTTATAMTKAQPSPVQRRIKLPEEDHASSSDSNISDDEANYCNRTGKISQSSQDDRQKRSIGPKSATSGRVVSWSSDHSDEDSDDGHTRSPQQKRSSFSNLEPTELERSYTYEHHDDNDAQSEASSRDAASDVSSGTQPMSLSFYRKFQKETGGATKRVVHYEPERKHVAELEDETRRRNLIVLYQEKIEALATISHQQHAILVQTTSALNLCRTAPEFQGSIERAECERLLLLSAKKRSACDSETRHLKSLLTDMKQGSRLPPHSGCHGIVTISSIQLSTKNGFVEFVRSDVENVHYFVMLIQHRDKVHATHMINSVQHLEPDGTINLPNAVTFEDLENDFVVHIDIYAVQSRRETVSHEEKYHINKDSGKRKEKGHTLKKLLPALKDGSASHMTVGTPSKQEIRSTSFGLVGSCLISLQNVHEKSFRLSQVPDHCALSGMLRLKATCGVTLENTEEGFLTIFEDHCGPSTWHRLWSVLQNDSILMWKYPEDMTTHRPKVLNLRTCLGDTESTSLSVCARPHTFQMMLSRSLKLSGLETRESGPYRYFLSADTKEERFVWQEKLNKVLGHIRAWIPNEKTIDTSRR